MNRKAEIVVLGAGIVGVSAALHLARRGRDVVLVDRQHPGLATSYGNAGLIQSEGVMPHAFPRDPLLLWRYALNATPHTHYHLAALVGIAPQLLQYWWHSEPKRYQAIVRSYAPFIAQSLPEHKALIDEAGAHDLIRKNGWVQVCRSARARDEAFGEAEYLEAEFGVKSGRIGGDALGRMEPHLMISLAGAVHWQEPWTVRDPAALTTAYFGLFGAAGGRFLSGDARSLGDTANGWTVSAETGPLTAREVVICLGPWSGDLTRGLGYRLPLFGKRGYHRHFAPAPGAELNNWLYDAEGGYFLTPMRAGIRLTTGVEFARRDAPKTPVQIDRTTQIARGFFPLGEPVEPEPWMGTRPCTPDMKPIVGRAPRHDNLWFDFGHAHHGLTLGPVSGRLLADLMTGETPFTDPAPFRPSRFAG